MRAKILFLMAALALGTAACGDQEQPQTEGTIENAPADKSPNPQTGTGGESQRDDPQGTAGQTAPPSEPQ